MDVQHIAVGEIPTTAVVRSGSDKPRFTRTQLQYLERVYGENPCDHTATEAQLRWNSGVRSVIAHIRRLTDAN